MHHEPKPPRDRAEELISLLGLLVPNWRPTPRHVLWAARITIVLGLLVVIGRDYGITLWDWLKLLVVPAAIAAGGLWFNHQQQERTRELQHQQTLDAALQAYENRMGELLLDRGLKTTEGNPEVRQVALLQTLTALRRLDADRKREVIQLLDEWGLIKYKTYDVAGILQKDPPIISLNGADLRGANLSRLTLTQTCLNGARLNEANLSGAVLSAMHGSSKSIFRAMELGVSPEETMEPILASTLVSAKLTGANLREARLLGVDFLYADLSCADLTDAQVTQEQLDQAETLRGATMPNGQKYEAWLRNNEGRGEDGKNCSP